MVAAVGNEHSPLVIDTSFATRTAIDFRERRKTGGVKKGKTPFSARSDSSTERILLRDGRHRWFMTDSINVDSSSLFIASAGTRRLSMSGFFHAQM